MEIIDGQVHLWRPHSVERPWPSGAASSQGPSFSIEEALAGLNGSGVARAILVPPLWTGGDNAYPLEAARLHPDRFAVMGHFDPDAAGGVERLYQWRHQSGMLGIRFVMDRAETLEYLRERRYAWIWAGCENARLPLMCRVPGHASEVRPIARRHPRLKLIVDHAGFGPLGEKASQADIRDLLELSGFPNVAVKFSLLPFGQAGVSSLAASRVEIERIYRAFGSRRLIWASDSPRGGQGYGEALRLFDDAMDFLSDEDREWIFGRSASEWCDWPF